MNINLKNYYSLIYSEKKFIRNPLLSVILVCYNHREYLKESLQYILESKTNFKFEILITDDCSNDNSIEILKLFQLQYPSLIKLLLSNENLSKYGSPGSLNTQKAYIESKGKYIALLEGDDYWTDPYKLQKQVDYLEANPSYAYCFHPVKMLYQKTGELCSTDYGAPRKDSEYNLNDLLENCNFVPTASLLFRTNLIQNLPKSFVHYPFGDWPLQMIALLKHGSEKFGCIQEEMAVYRVHEKGNRSGLNFINAQKRVIKCYLLVGRFLKLFHRHSWRKGFARWHMEIAIEMKKKNKVFPYFYYTFVAFLIAPWDYKEKVSYEILPFVHQQWQRARRWRMKMWKSLYFSQDLFKKTRRSISLYLFNLRVKKKYNLYKKEFKLETSFQEALESAISFVNQSNFKSKGQFKYAQRFDRPNLYASIYAAMLYHLTGDLVKLDDSEKKIWADYLLSHQDKDGLFRDPLMQCEIAESEDCWGWRHLTAHAVLALTVLGVKTKTKFSCLKSLYGENNAELWIRSLAWREKPDFVSNTVMNYGVMLQYERDFHDSIDAKNALEKLFEFLNESVCPKTGLWGIHNLDKSPKNVSVAVQTSYHIWNLYFYDKKEIPYIERAIDHCLLTQNNLGGYGVDLNSSACDDIDTIDPLCRFRQLTSYRKEDLEESLRKAIPWVLHNQMKDGGYVFKRYKSFSYGHELMTTLPEESHMFATWFRTLSLAYLSKSLPELKNFEKNFHWISCPGYQFWN